MILQKQDFVLPRNSFTGIGWCGTTLDPRVSRDYSSDEAAHAKILLWWRVSELLELDMDQREFSIIDALLCRFSIIWTWVLCRHQILFLIFFHISALLSPNKHTFTDIHMPTHIHTNVHALIHTHTACGWFEQPLQFLLPFILCVERKMKKIFISCDHKKDNKMRCTIFCNSNCKHEWSGKSKTKGDNCYVQGLRSIKSKERNLYTGTGTLSVYQTLRYMSCVCC